MRRLLPTLILLAACASNNQPAPPVTPEWEEIPAGIPAALCQRLQLDGIGSIGTDVHLVKLTQPIASAQVLAVLGKPRRAVPIVHRALPIVTPTGDATGCAWRAIDALDPVRQRDAMVVELSAPIANPVARAAAGMVARVSLGGTHPSWYWIELVPVGGHWAVGRILPLAM